MADTIQVNVIYDGNMRAYTVPADFTVGQLKDAIVQLGDLGQELQDLGVQTSELALSDQTPEDSRLVEGTFLEDGAKLENNSNLFLGVLVPDEQQEEQQQQQQQQQQVVQQQQQQQQPAETHQSCHRSCHQSCHRPKCVCTRPCDCRDMVEDPSYGGVQQYYLEKEPVHMSEWNRRYIAYGQKFEAFAKENKQPKGGCNSGNGCNCCNCGCDCSAQQPPKVRGYMNFGGPDGRDFAGVLETEDERLRKLHELNKRDPNVVHFQLDDPAPAEEIVRFDRRAEQRGLWASLYNKDFS